MIRELAVWTIALLCGGAPLPACAGNATDIVKGAIDGFVRPGYAAFHRATSSLMAAEKDLCAAPSQTTLDAARKSYGATVDAWSRIEIIRFGPVTEQNRLERVLFWPDRKGTGLRQVQAALASSDPTAADAKQLAGKSVAMQGLGALEFVLYGTGSEVLAAGDGYRCSYGAAIAGNLDAIAAELDAAWAAPDGFARIWANPSTENPLYRDGTEALTELMDVLVTGTELVRDVRLGGFLGKEAKDDKPRLALFWRSGKTVDALAGNLAGMKALLEASKLAGALPADQAWMGKEALFEFSNAANAAAAAQGPIAGVLADPERRGKLAYFGLVTSSLSNIFGTQMSGTLGLTAGFSSLDGD
ncbi:imelysin family protein [Mesorhizobium sp. KR9-304]|uniref:imelysin family protein n=1 Tax=Mesorhizobium sp. KR9-304 TaxID=3156614 RepID=UPI0032B3FA29